MLTFITAPGNFPTRLICYLKGVRIANWRLPC